MKNKIDKKKKYLILITLIGAILTTFEIGLVYLNETMHKQKHGHYVSYGMLHTDVVTFEADKTIGLNNESYSVRLANYTFIPIVLNGYRIGYSLEHRGDGIILLPYKREKLDKTTNKWVEVDFVDPGKTYRLEKKTVTLFPFQSIYVVDWDSPIVDKLFQPNDIIRYTVFLGHHVSFSQQELVTSSISVQ